MSYQVKIPETKYILELSQVKEDWYLQVKIDDSIEEQIQIVRFTSSHLEEKIDQILFNVGFSLNPVQLKIVTDNMREHASFLFGDQKASATQNEKMSDWASPSQVAAMTSTPPVAERRQPEPITPPSQYQPPSRPTPVARPAPSARPTETRSQTMNIDTLIQSHENLQSKVEQLETRITLLERIIRDLR